MNVTFCGHSTVADDAAVREWLRGVVRGLLAEGADVFYFGGYGAFDQMAAAVVREQRRTNAELVLALPYLNSSMDASGYDCTVYPPLERVPPRFAILRRNRWMVDRADVVVACITHGWGGAAQTLEYARRKKKRIVLYLRSEDTILPQSVKTSG